MEWPMMPGIREPDLYARIPSSVLAKSICGIIGYAQFLVKWIEVKTREEIIIAVNGPYFFSRGVCR